MLTQAPEESEACVWGKSISQRAAVVLKRGTGWLQDHMGCLKLTNGAGNGSSMGRSEWRSSQSTSLD